MPRFILRTSDFDSRRRVAEFESVAAQICELDIESSGEDYTSSTSIAGLSDAVIADTTHSPLRHAQNWAAGGRNGR